MVYAIVAGVILVVLAVSYWIWRTEYRRFQKMYRVKLPFLCTVTLTKDKDNIKYGTSRYRFVTQSGKKDKRHGFNFKLYFPTVVTINHFKVQMWNHLRANEIFLQLEPIMQLPLDKCPFRGEIKGDPIKFFRRSQVMFKRYCGKLLEFYGWKCVICYEGALDLSGYDGKKVWAIRCLLSETPIVLNDVIKLNRKDVDMPWLIMTNSVFSNGAKEYAWKQGWSLMDLSSLQRTILHEEVLFL